MENIGALIRIGRMYGGIRGGEVGMGFAHRAQSCVRLAAGRSLQYTIVFVFRLCALKRFSDLISLSCSGANRCNFLLCI